MMEHREPPRLVRGGEAPAEPAMGGEPRRPFARFVPPSGVRRLALPRLVLALLASAGFLAVALVAGRGLAGALAAFLHRQPEYAFAFHNVVLDPDAPPWLRGGRTAFLERVRNRAGLPEQTSVLDIDLHQLQLAFQLDCWVKKVTRVERKRSPNRVLVHLAYREPVAVADFRRADGKRSFLVDGEGVLLPVADVNLETLQRAVRIVGQKLDPPANPQFGAPWKRHTAEASEPEADASIAAAAALAAFLKPRQERASAGPAHEPGVVIQIYRDDLWVECGGRLFTWRAWRGPKANDDMSDQEKWVILRDWLDANPEPPGAQGLPRYYSIERTGVVRLSSARNS